ncbi:unnamed protein product [Brugia timori]|uniref:Uncharacterized protein n=1 Tax=Brugia timori TaxID=42155 RepID=A0A0R3QVP7_9BILA|nr:unnamed protein product [Brugia timori]
MNENNGEDTAIKLILSSFSCTSVNRLWKALLVGLVMRLAVSFLMIENIIWPWIILYMLSACKKVFQLSSVYAAVGYFLHPRLHLGLNLLSYAGYNTRFIALQENTRFLFFLVYLVLYHDQNYILGAVVQNIWCFIKESLMVALSFILFNALFCAFALIVDKCCLL